MDEVNRRMYERCVKGLEPAGAIQCIDTEMLIIVRTEREIASLIVEHGLITSLNDVEATHRFAVVLRAGNLRICRAPGGPGDGWVGGAPIVKSVGPGVGAAAPKENAPLEG